MSGPGVIGPDTLVDADCGILCRNMGLLSGKGSCSAGEYWLTSSGSFIPEALC
jgi:hypothetical protein